MPKTKRNNALDDLLVKQITETAIEIYKETEKKEFKLKRDRRLHNVKELMKNYERIKQSVKNVNMEDPENVEDILDIGELMSSEFVVESLSQSKHRSKLMVQHVDKTLRAYKQICQVESIDERYKIVYDRYIINLPAHKVAEKYGLSLRTFHREIDRACEDMSVLLFGIDAVSFKID